MKKLIVFFIMAFIFTGLSTACSNKQNLKLGTYVSGGELPSKLILQRNNKFSLFANDFIDHHPTGIYVIKDNYLILKFGEDEYTFLIEDDYLIFKSGTWLEHWIEQDSIFNLLDE